MHNTRLSRPLILASASPRRADLLAQIGLDFTVMPSTYHEPPPSPGEAIESYIAHASREKAWAVARMLPTTPAVLLAADTLVLLPIDGDESSPRLYGHPVEVMGKPRNDDDAVRMLRALSGRTHSVVSAFSLLAHPEGDMVTDVVETRVTFRGLSEEEIREYVAGGEPSDKAGAYGIQGHGAVLIDYIEGDYYTVVGLPLSHLWQALAPWRISM